MLTCCAHIARSKKSCRFNVLQLLIRTTKAAVSLLLHIIILTNAKRKKNPLRKAVSFANLNGFSLCGIVHHFYEDMPFVVAFKIIAVNNSYRVVKLQTIGKAQRAAGNSCSTQPS